jgi:Polyketide cyclase / dehydrase and lipid transport
MASVVREVLIDAKAADCWDALRDFGALHQRLAPGFITGLRLLGPREREVTFFTGAVATEHLVGIDEQSLRLAYTVVNSPMGSSHYNASAQVIADGADRCRFVWAIDVLPDELGERIGALMDKGMQAIKETLESSAVPR